MNCSQLLGWRPMTNWKRPAQAEEEICEHRETPRADCGLWDAVKLSSFGQTLAPRGNPSLKTSSN